MLSKPPKLNKTVEQHVSNRTERDANPSCDEITERGNFDFRLGKGTRTRVDAKGFVTGLFLSSIQTSEPPY